MFETRIKTNLNSSLETVANKAIGRVKGASTARSSLFHAVWWVIDEHTYGSWVKAPDVNLQQRISKNSHTFNSKL